MDKIIDQLTFQEDGLIPAIVQDATTKDVLMMAYMNEQSLRKTLETEETWFYSRSRQELWHKGATSGNTQTVKQLTYDCDGDALLVLVDPAGPACHTGEVSCFYNDILGQLKNTKDEIIPQLVARIEKRKQEQIEGSYTTYLFKEGIDKILKKIGEESSEIIIAAKNDDHEELVWEIADFIYHLLVLMNAKNVKLSNIYEELTKRFSK